MGIDANNSGEFLNIVLIAYIEREQIMFSWGARI
jgi:hypothetical protein